jgi:penicillin-binding protein 1C
MKYLYKKKVAILLLGAGLLYFLFCLPEHLFSDPYSTVLYSQEGMLLNAKTAKDGQWRFPSKGEVPEKFAKALISFEDQRFYYHPGVDVIGISRAAVQNIREKRVVSGGSTLTMQLMRMARGSQARTVWQKVIEIIWAIRTEIRHSKKDILQLYADHAPYGGNVVGLEAASWRYFGKNSDAMTWAESCMLAVLPNAPSLIHPGRNRDKLLKKRDKLLKKLKTEGTIDAYTFEAALLEAIPEKPLRLPNLAYHYSNRKAAKTTNNSFLNGRWQQDALRVLNNHQEMYGRKGIHNSAVIVVNNKSGKILVYHGNTSGSQNENMVDMVTAPRSSGSILKPFLYGLAMEEGMIAPEQLLPDIPTNIGGFNPKNYNKEYHGAVSAREALVKSLNVPMVHLLKEYGVERFFEKLKEIGISTLHRSPGDYGLSLILGGAEVALEDLVLAYSSLAKQLLDYEDHYRSADYKKPAGPLSAGSIYQVFEAMKSLQRPDDEGFWEQYLSSFPIAWKTGTSYGHRDAWAIGINRDYTIGVWVGNADGEGHPEIVGSKAAGALMFDIWNLLPRKQKWFSLPHDEFREQQICLLSGHPASHHCIKQKRELIPGHETVTDPCPYHRPVALTVDKKFRTFLGNDREIIDTSWFVLPPAMAHYYQKNHPEYTQLPPVSSNRTESGMTENEGIRLLFPAPGEELYLPTGMNGQQMELIAEAVTSNKGMSVYWHLDGTYLGETDQFHQLKFLVPSGQHRLMLMDEYRNKVVVQFKVVGSNPNGSYPGE